MQMCGDILQLGVELDEIGNFCIFTDDKKMTTAVNVNIRMAQAEKVS